MPSYQLTNKAVEDLSAIWNYSFEVWSEAQADTYYYLLLDSCQALAEGKVTGKRYDEIGNDIFGFRIGQHLLFYRKLAADRLEVVRILHSRMDLKSRMGE